MNEPHFGHMQKKLEELKTDGSNGGSNKASLEHGILIEHMQFVLECQSDITAKIDTIQTKSHQTDLQIQGMRKDLTSHIEKEKTISKTVDEIHNAIKDPEDGMVVRINKMQTERCQELQFQKETKERIETERILDIEAKKARNWQLVMIICVLVIVGGKEVIPYLLKLLAFFP
jgi:hypothetical protein